MLSYGEFSHVQDFGPVANEPPRMPPTTRPEDASMIALIRQPGEDRACGMSTGNSTQEWKEPVKSKAMYSSKIIKAGALLADTKTLLAHWNVADSVQENVERIRQDNLFGKASRSRVEDILAIFRQRYLTEESVTKALVTLVRGRFPTAALEPLLYFHSARADRLLHDAVTEILVPMQARGLMDIGVQDLHRPLATWVEEGKTTGHWSEPTITRISQGLLSALRDFGVLQGAVNKKIALSFLPTESFAYIVFYLKQHQPSGAKLIELPDWNLFFLPREGVERFLFEAHQRELLEVVLLKRKGTSSGKGLGATWGEE